MATELPSVRIAKSQNGKAGLTWCRTVVDVIKNSLREEPTEFKTLIATLLAWDPSLRGSATDCHRRALRLSEEIEEGCQTPTQQSFAEEGQRTILQEAFKDGGDESPMRTQPTEMNSTRLNYGHNGTTVLAENPRFRKSGGPPPETPAPERKKQKRSALADEALSGLDHGDATREDKNADNLQPWLDALHPLGGGSSLVASILGMSRRDETTDLDSRNLFGGRVHGDTDNCVEQQTQLPTLKTLWVPGPVTTDRQGSIRDGSLPRPNHTGHSRLVSKSEQEMAMALFNALQRD